MFFRKPKIYFQEDHNQVLKDIVSHFERTDKIQEADRFVLWTDTTIDTQGLIDYARRRNKKTIVVQHGRKGSCRYYPPFNFPIQADKMLVWGDYDKQRLVEAGHPAEKIVVTGTTIWEHFKNPRKELHKEINIVFSPEHWDREVPENKKAARILNLAAKKNGWNIITKIIEGHDPKLYRNPVFSDRSDPEHFNIIKSVLAQADVVVGISDSTFELIAQYHEIPVVIVNEWNPKTFGGDERYYTYQRLISESVVKAKYDTLEKEIISQLENPKELADARMVTCAEEGGIAIADSLERIIREIEK